jgi:hypothetical protein
MIGGSGSSGSASDLSNYLVNFNSSSWANQANQQLQSSLNQGLGSSTALTQAALNTQNQANTVAQNQLNTGLQQSQALNAPQQLATYNALDAYQNNLGLSTPAGGSFALAQNMNNNATGAPVANPAQVAGYNSGLLSNVPTSSAPL